MYEFAFKYKRHHRLKNNKHNSITTAPNLTRQRRGSVGNVVRALEIRIYEYTGLERAQGTLKLKFKLTSILVQLKYII